MNELNQMFEKLTDFLKSEVKTETLIGKSFQVGEFTCVPVIKVGMGFGGGSGEGKDPKQGAGSGTGAGAGLGMEPIGFLVTRADFIQFIPTVHHKGLSAVMDKIPDLMEKYFEHKRSKEANT